MTVDHSYQAPIQTKLSRLFKAEAASAGIPLELCDFANGLQGDLNSPSGLYLKDEVVMKTSGPQFGIAGFQTAREFLPKSDRGWADRRLGHDQSGHGRNQGAEDRWCHPPTPLRHITRPPVSASPAWSADASPYPRRAGAYRSG